MMRCALSLLVFASFVTLLLVVGWSPSSVGHGKAGAISLEGAPEPVVSTIRQMHSALVTSSEAFARCSEAARSQAIAVIELCRAPASSPPKTGQAEFVKWVVDNETKEIAQVQSLLSYMNDAKRWCGIAGSASETAKGLWDSLPAEWQQKVGPLP